jgi:hypothetical protein
VGTSETDDPTVPPDARSESPTAGTSADAFAGGSGIVAGVTDGWVVDVVVGDGGLEGGGL